MTVDSNYVFVEASDHTTLALYVARPADRSQKAPALIVLQEAFGVNAHIRDIAERCARAGYLAVAPELFHRTAPHGFEGAYDNFNGMAEHYRAVTESTLEADLSAAYRWLQTDPQCAATRIAAIGFCLGGRAAFIANAVLPLRAAICYYGGGIAPALLPRAAQQHGPVLLVWGGRDRSIDLSQRRSVGDALRAVGKNFVELEYADAEHGFFCDRRASYNAHAASESWALVLAFLHNRLTY